MKAIIAFCAAWFLPLLVFCHDEDYEWANEMSYEFPDVNSDLTKVTWVHAVNSQAKLKEALKGDAMFLEADVSIGRYTGDNEDGLLMPIMAHPPETSSDLTLQQFLDETLKTEKHIKLDFKTRMAFSASEHTVSEAQMKYSYGKKIWLNADIIPGPINCSKPVVDSNYFLSTCVTKFPDAVISAGWATCYSDTNSKGGYTSEHIEEMTDALNKNMVMGTVTFPMRAGIAAQSFDPITRLMKTALPETTLTIWSSPGDPVDVPKLAKLINTVGRDRVFIDVPEDLYKKLIVSMDTRSADSSSSLLTVSTLTLLSSILFIKMF